MPLVTENVLMVDDDPRMLASMVRQLHGKLNMVTAANGAEGLDVASRKGPFAVVVSDYKMPGIDGVTFLTRIKEMYPETARILLTGYADIENAIRAVNEGDLFRFLTKPCDSQVFLRTVLAGIKQFRLEKGEKELLEQTVAGSFKLLTDVLGLFNPDAVGRSTRIRDLAILLGNELGLDELWALSTAASLSKVGFMLLSQEALHRLYSGQELEGEDKQIFDMNSSLTADLIRNIPRMERISEIITFQDRKWNGDGPPASIERERDDLPIESRIIKVAMDFDLLVQQGKEPQAAYSLMKTRQDWYDAKVIKAMFNVLIKLDDQSVKEVDINDLTEVMTIVDGVFTVDGRLIVAGGQKVNRLLVRHLQKFDANFGIRRPLLVTIAES